MGAFPQMVSERQRKDSAHPPITPVNDSEKTMYFLAEVCCTYLAILHFLFLVHEPDLCVVFIQNLRYKSI